MKSVNFLCCCTTHSSNACFSFYFVYMFIDSSVKIVDFTKKNSTVCNEIEEFIGFKVYWKSLLNIQNGGLH